MKKCVFLLVLFFARVAGAQTFVQACINNNSASGTTITCSLSGTVGANDLIVGIVSWGSSGGRVSGVADGGGATYTVLPNTLPNASGISSQVFFTCAAVSGASDTITATFAATEPFRQINAIDMSGLTSTKCLDVGKQSLDSSGASTSAASGSNTTLTATDLLVGLFTNFNGVTWTAGTDGQGDTYTMRSSNTITAIETVNVTSSKSYSANATLSAGSSWNAHFLAFRTTAYTTGGKTGRFFNGVTDYLQGSYTGNIANPALAATGSISFKLNLNSYPGASQVAVVLSFPYSHFGVLAGFGTGCNTSTTCVDLVYTGPSPPFSFTANQFEIDITAPTNGETCTRYSQPSLGLHTYVIVFAATQANNAFYLDGAAQSGTSCSTGAPSINMSGPITVMGAGTNTSPPALYLANGTISDIGIWNVALTAGERTALFNCVPPNRVRPEALAAYIPVYGQDSPEPNYDGMLRYPFGSVVVTAPAPQTVTNTTVVSPGNRVGCQPGGAYAP